MDELIQVLKAIHMSLGSIALCLWLMLCFKKMG